MAYVNYAQEYRKGAVLGASPVQLVIMLYDGALRFMEAGKAAMKEGNLPKQDHFLQKAQRVTLELMSSLDMKQGGEVSKNLLGLYTYVTEQLVIANCKDDVDAIDRSMRIFSELRESWVEVEKIVRNAAQEEVPLAA